MSPEPKKIFLTWATNMAYVDDTLYELILYSLTVAVSTAVIKIVKSQAKYAWYECEVCLSAVKNL